MELRALVNLADLYSTKPGMHEESHCLPVNESAVRIKTSFGRFEEVST